MQHWVYHVAAVLFMFFSLCHSVPVSWPLIPKAPSHGTIRRAAKVKLPVADYDYLPTRGSREPNPLKGWPHQAELQAQENILQARHRLQQIKHAAKARPRFA